MLAHRDADVLEAAKDGGMSGWRRPCRPYSSREHHIMEIGPRARVKLAQVQMNPASRASPKRDACTPQVKWVAAIPAIVTRSAEDIRLWHEDRPTRQPCQGRQFNEIHEP